MENFNDKLDAIFEVIENIPADASYIPTVEEKTKWKKILKNIYHIFYGYQKCLWGQKIKKKKKLIAISII